MWNKVISSVIKDCERDHNIMWYKIFPRLQTASFYKEANFKTFSGLNRLFIFQNFFKILRRLYEPCSLWSIMWVFCVMFFSSAQMQLDDLQTQCRQWVISEWIPSQCWTMHSCMIVLPRPDTGSHLLLLPSPPYCQRHNEQLHRIISLPSLHLHLGNFNGHRSDLQFQFIK